MYIKYDEYFISNGHSPQIRRNGELLVRMCRMQVTVWRMYRVSNVSSPGKVVGEWRANVSSPAKMAEMAILGSTRIRQTGEF